MEIYDGTVGALRIQPQMSRFIGFKCFSACYVVAARFVGFQRRIILNCCQHSEHFPLVFPWQNGQQVGIFWCHANM